MPKTLPDIEYQTEKDNYIVDSKNAFYKLPYYKDNEYFSNYESYVNFVKGCERTVRHNDRYNKYLAYLKKEIKLNKCQVFKNVTDEDASIEMHHTIFTLFDICSIIIEYFLSKNWNITTFRIADAVLTEHENNRIPIVMLSTTVHQEVHNGSIIITYDMVYGDVASFIKKYNSVISNDLKEQVNRFIDNSLLRNPDDFGVLDLNPDIYRGD